MVYDVARQRVVLFGGHNGTTVLNDTWEWNGATWTPRSPAMSPAARGGHTMAYDLVAQRVLLFGGYDGTAFLNDTWEWDGTTWRQVATTGPTGRSEPAMAYDLARQSIVLFGGHNSTSVPRPLRDTWSWNGKLWTQLTPATSPPARLGSCIAYDASRQRVVLFGGLSGSFQNLDDVWEWDGMNWATPTPSPSPRPRGRYGPALAYDHARLRCVLTAGSIGGPGLVDDWEWDGSKWQQVATYIGPEARGRHALAYDASRQQVVLFGGYSLSAVGYSDTWTFDGWHWRQGAGGPIGRYQHAMAYDAQRQRVVLFGGANPISTALSDTWEWNGTAWASMTPTTSPPGRRSHAMAFDPVRQRTVLFGGTSGSLQNDTWEWDGTSWAQVQTTAGPSAREGHAMAYDPVGQKLLLFGGFDASKNYLNETWEFDGKTWAQRFPVLSPAGRSTHAMATDTDRREVVIFGGMTSGGALDDAWAWNGSTWSLRATKTNPPRRSVTAMAYDPARKLMVVFGGSGVSEWLGDLWLLGSARLAATQPIGTGCSGSNGTPILTSRLPGVGNGDFALELLGTLPAMPCVVALATATKVQQLGSCTLYLSGTLVPGAAVSNGSGFASLPLPIPNEPALRGTTLHAQGFGLDPKGPFAGLAFSQALKLTLGD